MARFPIATGCGLTSLLGLGLLLCALSSPIGIPKATHARLDPTSFPLEAVITPGGPLTAFTSVAPVGTICVGDSSALIEENEEESVDSLSCHVGLAFIMPNGPTRVRPGPFSGHSPNIVSIPLRC